MKYSVKNTAIIFTFLLLLNSCMAPGSVGGGIGSLGLTELLIVLVPIVVILFMLLGKRKSGLRISAPTLVLKKFHIENTESSKMPVEIIGRASGITAWLLTTMGLDAQTKLSVYKSKIIFKSSSLYGEVHQVIPMASISSTHCGYSKPFGTLILGILLLLGGIILSQFLLGLIFGAIFLTAYFLKKKISISLETSGGMQLGLSFKRSVIENVSVDIEQALEVIIIINNSILHQQEK